MYSKGMSTKDIASHFEEIYGFQEPPTLISNITDKIMPIAKEWQNKPLESIYPVIFLNAIHYKVRSDGKVVNKAGYIIMGLNLDGIKDILGIWIGENESSKYWLNVLNELKNRGVQDVLLACIDGYGFYPIYIINIIYVGKIDFFEKRKYSINKKGGLL